MPLTVFNYNLINKRENKGSSSHPSLFLVQHQAVKRLDYQAAAGGERSRGGGWAAPANRAWGAAPAPDDGSPGCPPPHLPHEAIYLRLPAAEAAGLLLSLCRADSRGRKKTGPTASPSVFSLARPFVGTRQASSFLHLYRQRIPMSTGKHQVLPAEAPPSPWPQLPHSSACPRVRETFVGSLPRA